MQIGVFIPALDAWLEGHGLAYVVSILNILFAFGLARLAVSFVVRLCQTLLRFKAKAASEQANKQLHTAATVLGSLSKYVFYFVAAAIALGELGLSSAMNSMLAAAGIGGIALGIGAQGLISDVATGLFLLFEDQIRVEEYIQVGDVSGTVESITLRTITIRGPRGELNVIPNSKVTHTVNFSRTNYMALAEMNILYESDVDKALAIMVQETEKYVKEIGDIAVEAPVDMGIAAMENGIITLRVGVRVKPLEHWKVQRELIRRFKQRFDEEQIERPYTRISVARDG